MLFSEVLHVVAIARVVLELGFLLGQRAVKVVTKIIADHKFITLKVCTCTGSFPFCSNIVICYLVA